MPGTSKEPVIEVPAPTPSATAQGTSSAARVGSDKAEGSKNPTVRLVPFQSMPQSTKVCGQCEEACRLHAMVL